METEPLAVVMILVGSRAVAEPIVMADTAVHIEVIRVVLLVGWASMVAVVIPLNSRRLAFEAAHIVEVAMEAVHLGNRKLEAAILVEHIVESDIEDSHLDNRRLDAMGLIGHTVEATVRDSHPDIRIMGGIARVTRQVFHIEEHTTILLVAVHLACHSEDSTVGLALTCLEDKQLPEVASTPTLSSVLQSCTSEQFHRRLLVRRYLAYIVYTRFPSFTQNRGLAQHSIEVARAGPITAIYIVKREF